MSDIKIPSEPSHLEDVTKYGWDLVIGNVDYDVYSISDYYHSIGGKMGLNSLYCCPSDQPLTIDNMTAFCGVGAPRWQIRWKGINFHKNKWNEHSIEHNGTWQIYRNELLFFEGGARDMEYGLAKAQIELMWLLEGPIAFHFRNWRDEVNNRKIYYHNQPAIVTSIIESGQLCVIVAPDGMDKFESPPMHKDWWGQEGEVEHKTAMNDPAIYWHRD